MNSKSNKKVDETHDLGNGNGNTFTDKTVGGSIPKEYIPAIIKGDKGSFEMTTTVAVTTHNWEVEVSGLNPHSGLKTSRNIVPKNSSATFYIHSDMDILVHEVQPTKEVINNG